ncbi:MAG TPA: hypothetical protein VI636_17205 [Candidatus Angelobacter sp.]
MDQQTVELLVRSLGDLASSVNELLAKIAAAEKVFQARSPEAYKEYQKYLDSLKKTGASRQLAQALANLQRRLLSQPKEN